MELSSQELKRYARHLTLPEVGIDGQKKLKDSSVLVVGCGGLGCPLVTYLAAAGVGRIGLIDFDVVDESNLQRQVLFSVSDVGLPKVDVAKQRILGMNPHVTVETYQEALTTDNALELFDKYDIVADGTDNFATRYLVNDACVLTNTPNVYGSIFRFEGQVTVFNYNDGPNYRCLYKEPPPPGLVPSCAEGGVLGVLPGVVATLQATEVIKILLNIGDISSGKLLIFDALKMSFRQLAIKKRSDYKIESLIDYQQFCGVKNMENNIEEISVNDLKTYIDQNKEIELIDVREEFEYEICNIESAKLIPLGQFEEHLSQLDKSKSYVIHCKMGGRSAKAVELMKSNGFNDVKNLAGLLLGQKK